MKYFIHNYGCQMNVHEGAQMEAALAAAGFERAKKPIDADLVVFNTCCIRDTAEAKVISHIGEAGRIKRERKIAGLGQVIAVVGCLGAREGMAKELKRKFPFVDIVLGQNKKDLLNIEYGILNMKGKNNNLQSSMLNTQYSIKITEGCENFCSYCIVPYVRGKEVSRTAEEIENEFDELLKQRASRKRGELLKAQKTPVPNGTTLNKIPPLVKGVLQEISRGRVEGAGAQRFNGNEKLCWSPTGDGGFCVVLLGQDFSHELVDFVAQEPKIERNIHLPIQSGCDKILKKMNRKYTVSEYEEKVQYLREKVPGVHITTDIICGFPGETDEDFARTVETIKRIKFDAAFIFPYSRRSGTLADKLDGQIDTATRKRRATELIQIQRGISNTPEHPVTHNKIPPA